jgi:hypothetical protein
MRAGLTSRGLVPAIGEGGKRWFDDVAARGPAERHDGSVGAALKQPFAIESGAGDRILETLSKPWMNTRRVPADRSAMVESTKLPCCRSWIEVIAPTVSAVRLALSTKAVP